MTLYGGGTRGERLASAVLMVALALSGCSRTPATRTYVLQGQVLAVHPDRQQITVRHEDIPGFMPGMTMSFPVATPDLLTDRKPGDLVTATLEVSDSLGRLTTIEVTGFAELPADTNAAAMAGNLIEEGDEAPDAAFIDQADRRRAFAEWRGTVTLLTFIYTRCPLPNFCPLIDRQFATLQQRIAADRALSGRIQLVTISFDPDFDTPAVLARHAETLKADPAVWTFLTADRATVDRFAARFGVGLVRPADSPEITHNLRTILIGGDGRVRKIYSGSQWTPSLVMEDLRAAARRP